ncbi:MAG: hypothetical protein V8Q82_09085 [Christensenellales bacterium]
MAINPERATALEISRLLRFPFANNIESFARGGWKWWSSARRRTTRWSAARSRKLQRKLHGIPQVLYAAVEREGSVIIPDGDFVIRTGRPRACGGGYGDDHLVLPLSGQEFPAHQKRDAPGRRTHQLLSGQDDRAHGRACQP